MKSPRSLYLTATCVALLLLGFAQSGRDTVASLAQRVPYRDLPVAKRHKGIEVALVDAFSYRPYERAAELGDTPSATIDVTYSGFPPEAETAFEYAVAIWENTISSPVPIRIDATWTTLPGTTVAQATAAVVAVFPGQPIPNTWFIEALGDKLAGVDLFPGDPDIVAQFDSAPPAPWYFELDGLPPTGALDFVTVALHELGHGLGFLGSAFVDAGSGFWGIEADPGVFWPVSYDRYTRASGTPIINFARGSAALATALTGGDLFFASPVVLDRPAISAPAKLFAPTPWDDETSYSHLDEVAYPAGNANALMTPTIQTAEANHNPGPVTGEIFTDIGWGAIGGGAVPGQPTVTSAVAAGGTLTVAWASGGGGAPTSHRLDFYSGGNFLVAVNSGAATTASIPLPPGVVGTFQVGVTAINLAGSSPLSALFTFTIGSGAAPGQPTVTSAVATGGVLNVAWTSGAGAAPTSHRLDFYSGGTLVAQVTVGAATNTAVPIPPGVAGTFGVRVTAFNGATAGPPSAEFAFTIGPVCTLPAAPIVSGGVVSGTASVNWQPVAGATSYIVSAGTSAGGTQYLAPTNVGGALGVGASGLPPGFFAWVRVIAVNACGQQGPHTDFLVQ